MGDALSVPFIVSCTCECLHYSLRSWRYCVIKLLAAELRSKKRSGDEAFGSAPPNLTRLVHNTASYAGYLHYESVYSEDDLRSRIFGTFVVKFLASLPLLGFSNI